MNTLLFSRDSIFEKAVRPYGSYYRWLALLLVLIFLFLLCGPFLRLLDPAAAAVDIGILSLPVLGLLVGLGFMAISQWLLGLLWPALRTFHNQRFEILFNSLRPWQQIVIYLCCFFLLLYAFVACLAVIC